MSLHSIGEPVMHCVMNDITTVLAALVGLCCTLLYCHLQVAR